MKILFVSVNRSDYGIWRSILKLIKINFKDYKIGIFATGGHLSKRHGNTINEIINDKFYNDIFQFPCTIDNDSPMASTAAISMIPQSLGLTINNFRPDLICVLGDRYEMLTAALSASLFQIPIVHFHGGSLTEGAVDDNFRHAISKLSHYHFVECEEFKQRLMQLGEEEEEIFISGAPSLNELKSFNPVSEIEFKEKYDLDLNEDFVLATLHSETTKSHDYNAKLAINFFGSLKSKGYKILLTAPNPDPFSQPILDEIEKELSKKYSNINYIPHLGHANYFNALHFCAFMVGNSSSGIIEAASFEKHVLNIGERQKNRSCDKNVINCGITKAEIEAGLLKIQKSLIINDFFKGWSSIYRQEKSEQIILNFFRKHKPYYQKKFCDKK